MEFTVTKAEVNIALIGCKRTVLIRFAKSLCDDAGFPSKGRKVAAMATDLSGRKLSTPAAWVYLMQRMEGHQADRAPMRAPRVKTAAQVASKAFYASREWRAVRFDALKRSNGCCALCGRSPRHHAVVIHVDHIKPRSLRPDLELTLSNLQPLCDDCNLGKSNRDDTDWRVGRPDKETPP